MEDFIRLFGGLLTFVYHSLDRIVILGHLPLLDTVRARRIRGCGTCSLASIMDGLSTLYQDLLSGSYDSVDRIVLNAYFPMGHSSGGFRRWWRALTGSDDTLHNTYLMRMAGRFSRRLRGYAKAHGIPVIDCSVGERKQEIAEEYLTKTKVTRGLFLILVGRARAPLWKVGAITSSARPRCLT